MDLGIEEGESELDIPGHPTLCIKHYTYMNILYTLQNEHGVLQFDTHTTKIGTAENEQYY